jgi:Arc/MetJ family transcription regulator
MVYNSSPKEFKGREVVMGRTNIVLDEKLMKKAIQLTGAKSKREAVQIALDRLVKQGDVYESLRKLRGKIRWEGDLKAMRRSKYLDR